MTTVADIMAASPAAFGTSGLRGTVEALSDEVCFAATLGFLDHMKTTRGTAPGTAVMLAHDLRPSSPRIARAAAAAIRHAGFEPIFGGTVPTPALALASLGDSVPAVMVTGSHIPFDRNGIKFYRPDGEMAKADEAPVLQSRAQLPDDLTITDLPEATSAVETGYAVRWLQVFPGLLEDMRIGLYQHSAVGRDFNAALFGDLGGKVAVLDRSDQFVPIDTEAVGEADAAQAREWALEGIDCVISTDGDGDRPLLSDENGEYFRGDVLGIFTARFLGARTVVTPVSSNTALEASGWFDRTIRTKIGSPHVLAAMAEADGDGVVGFEANGGFLTRDTFEVNGEPLDPLATRDALLPILATIALAKRESVPLSGLRALLPPRVTRSDRLENRPTEASRAYLDAFDGSLLEGFGPVVVVDETDGRRMTLADGRIVHLRPSGNAPEFRVYVEAADEAGADSLLAAMLTRLGVALPAD